jgi:pyruvate,water dikinase
MKPPRRRERREKRGWKVNAVQGRLDLKGKVTEVYSRLLAEVRWCFVALEEIWLRSGLLSESGDIFFLEFDEVRRIIEGNNKSLIEQVSQLVEKRRSQLKQDSQLTNIPPLVYGNAPPILNFIPQSSISTKLLQGIGASPGQAEGKVKVIRNLQAILILTAIQF